MELKNLKTFMQIVESKSFTKAADILGYTQSTVSFQIKELEEELNCRLFDRIGKKIVLTTKGELLLDHALKISASFGELKESFNAEEKPAGIVRLFSSDSICEKMMKLNYHDFYNKYPDIHLIFSTGSTTDMLEVLDHNDADVIFTLDNHVYRQDCIIAGESPVPLHFVTNSSSPLAAKSEPTIHDIMKYPIYLTESNLSYRKILDDTLAHQSIFLSPVLETGRTDILLRCLEKGDGVSFLPDFVTDELVERGVLKRLEIKDMEITIWKQLIYKKEKWLSKALCSFINYVVDHEFKW